MNSYLLFLQAVDLLIGVLKTLSIKSKKKPIIYLTQELRNDELQKNLWSSFYDKLTDSFHVEKIPEEEQHLNYRSTDIVLLRIYKK